MARLQLAAALCAALAAAPAAGQGLQSDMPLYIVGEAALAKFPNAYCLDGTRPGYWWRPARNGAMNKWRIHLRGGGWCTTVSDCAARANSELGSTSATYTPAFFNGSRNADWGLLSVRAALRASAAGTWSARLASRPDAARPGRLTFKPCSRPRRRLPRAECDHQPGRRLERGVHGVLR